MAPQYNDISISDTNSYTEGNKYFVRPIRLKTDFRLPATLNQQQTQHDIRFEVHPDCTNQNFVTEPLNRGPAQKVIYFHPIQPGKSISTNLLLSAMTYAYQNKYRNIILDPLIMFNLSPVEDTDGITALQSISPTSSDLSITCILDSLKICNEFGDIDQKVLNNFITTTIVTKTIKTDLLNQVTTITKVQYEAFAKKVNKKIKEDKELQEQPLIDEHISLLSSFDALRNLPSYCFETRSLVTLYQIILAHILSWIPNTAYKYTLWKNRNALILKIHMTIQLLICTPFITRILQSKYQIPSKVRGAGLFISFLAACNLCKEGILWLWTWLNKKLTEAVMQKKSSSEAFNPGMGEVLNDGNWGNALKIMQELTQQTERTMIELEQKIKAIIPEDEKLQIEIFNKIQNQLSQLLMSEMINFTKHDETPADFLKSIDIDLLINQALPVSKTSNQSSNNCRQYESSSNPHSETQDQNQDIPMEIAEDIILNAGIAQFQNDNQYRENTLIETIKNSLYRQAGECIANKLPEQLKRKSGSILLDVNNQISRLVTAKLDGLSRQSIEISALQSLITKSIDVPGLVEAAIQKELQNCKDQTSTPNFKPSKKIEPNQEDDLD